MKELAIGGGEGGAGGAGGGDGACVAAYVAAAPTATPAPATAETAPKFLGVLEAPVDLPNAGALEVNTGRDAGEGAVGVKAALRLRASSSSACFLARAWRSDQVNFFAPPGDGVEALVC